MELTYLLAARGIEVTDLTIANATDIGIIVNRRKGSKNTIIRWTPRLKTAWDAALTLHKTPPAPTTTLLKAARGVRKLTRDALTNAWQNLKTKMEAAGLGSIYFWLHDLKRKGISDAADDRIAGHISDKVRANYNVKYQEFDAPA
jgi:integrase